MPTRMESRIENLEKAVSDLYTAATKARCEQASMQASIDNILQVLREMSGRLPGAPPQPPPPPPLPTYGEDKDMSWVRDEGEEELRKLTDADMDDQSIADHAFQSQKCDPTLVVVDQLIKLHGFFIVTARAWLIMSTLWGKMFNMAATKLKVQIPQFHLEDKVSLEAVGNDGTIVGDIIDSGALLWAISSGVWARSSGSSLFKGGWAIGKWTWTLDLG